MNSFFTRTFFIAFLIFYAGAAFAQVKFSAIASPGTAGKGEYITLKLTAENAHAIEQIRMPALRDFNIVSGPDQENGMSAINGNVKRYTAVSYVLQPKRTGRINIPCAVATIAGKDYKSNALTVTVSNKTSAQSGRQSLMQQNPFAGTDPFEAQQPTAEFRDYILRKGENVPEKVSRNMTLRLQTDKTTVYAGQPVLATYKLYTRLKSESSLSKNPSFNGFSVVDMQQSDGSTYSRESLGGKEYNVYVIRKAQLYPLQAGIAELEAATLDNRIGFIKYSGSNRDAFNIDPNAIITENVSLSSKPVSITVKPLPEAGKPASFKGAVGTFRVESSLEKNSFSTDETGKLIVTVGGSGNMQLLTSPDVQWPAGFEAFEAKVSENIDNTVCPLTGSKTFEIPFVIQAPGNYSLPPVSFSWFDPVSASYKTAYTKEISFTVTKGTGNQANEKEETGAVEKESLLDTFIGKRWLIILFVAGFIIAGMIFWTVSDKKKTKTESLLQPQDPAQKEIMDHVSEAAAASQQNPLQLTADCLLQEECVEFYAVLSHDFKYYLSQRFNLEEPAVNAKTIAVKMDEAGIDNDTILETQQLIRDINLRLYTPFEQTAQLNEMYARAQTVIQLINVQRS